MIVKRSKSKTNVKSKCVTSNFLIYKEFPSWLWIDLVYLYYEDVSSLGGDFAYYYTSDQWSLTSPGRWWNRGSICKAQGESIVQRILCHQSRFPTTKRTLTALRESVTATYNNWKCKWHNFFRHLFYGWYANLNFRGLIALEPTFGKLAEFGGSALILEKCFRMLVPHTYEFPTTLVNSSALSRTLDSKQIVGVLWHWGGGNHEVALETTNWCSSPWKSWLEHQQTILFFQEPQSTGSCRGLRPPRT